MPVGGLIDSPGVAPPIENVVTIIALFAVVVMLGVKYVSVQFACVTKSSTMTGLAVSTPEYATIPASDRVFALKVHV